MELQNIAIRANSNIRPDMWHCSYDIRFWYAWSWKWKHEHARNEIVSSSAFQH